MLTPTAITSTGASLLNDLVPSITEVTGTFSFDETNAAEQILTTVTIAQRSEINAFWLDLSNCTINVTLRLYHEIDGTTLRLFQENLWTTLDDDGVLVAGLVANDNVRLTLQCDGSGVGSVNIPYTIL